VDDHPAFRDAARRVLARSGAFEIVGEAVNGEESVDQALRLQPDLVLMDVRLPGIDGLEAARRITGQASHPVVLLISIAPREDHGARLSSSGAAGYLAKESFGLATLKAAWQAASGG
jgi:DNA-binding NarL/FixJ family response regulator